MPHCEALLPEKIPAKKWLVEGLLFPFLFNSISCLRPVLYMMSYREPSRVHHDQDNFLVIKCTLVVFVFHIGAALCTEKIWTKGEPHYPAFYSLTELATMAFFTAIERKYVEKVSHHPLSR